MKIRFLVLFIACLSTTFSQDIPLYNWRTHFALRLAKTGAIVGNDIFVGCEQGVFSYNLSSDKYKVYSKVDGISGYEVNRIAYDPKTGKMIIAYSDGNIDFYKNERFTNLPDFYLNSFSGSKETNHIYIKDGIAFLSTNAGLLLVDLNKEEIKETYAYIGPNASLLSVYASTITNDSIYICSNFGVMAGAFNPNVNLQNYNKWKTYQVASNNAKSTTLTSFNGKIYASIGDYVFSNQNGIFKVVEQIGLDGGLKFLNSDLNQLYVTYYNKTKVFDKNLNFVSEFPHNDINEFLLDGDKKYEISKFSGLGLYNSSNNRFDYKFPSSPYTNRAGKTRFYDNKVFSIPGFIVSSGEIFIEPGVLNVFDGNSWSKIIEGQNDVPTFYTPYDLLIVGDTMMVPSFNGFMKIHKSSFKGTLYTEKNSNLTPFVIGKDDGYYVCSAIGENTKGEVFIAQGFRSKGDYSYFKNGTSNNFTLLYGDPNTGRLTRKMTIDKNNNIWMVSSRSGWTADEGAFSASGVTVYNGNVNSSIKYKILNSEETKGKLTSNFVNHVAETKSGEIWLATDNGISVISEPQRIFSNTIPNSTVPVYDSRALLRDKIVNTICVDAADRKWIATANDGAWLFNANGDSLLQRFTMNNSPLPSNEIVDIGINPANGEVYFSTLKGLVSYRSDATDPNVIVNDDVLKYKVKAFPNPVTPDFDGTVGISGLGINAVVKITDISGKLVYETKANGGTATWNGKDLNDSRVASGIYMVFSTTAEGEMGLVTKIAVIN